MYFIRLNVFRSRIYVHGEKKSCAGMNRPRIKKSIEIRFLWISERKHRTNFIFLQRRRIAIVWTKFPKLICFYLSLSFHSHFLLFQSCTFIVSHTYIYIYFKWNNHRAKYGRVFSPPPFSSLWLLVPRICLLFDNNEMDNGDASAPYLQ